MTIKDEFDQTIQSLVVAARSRIAGREQDDYLCDPTWDWPTLFALAFDRGVGLHRKWTRSTLQGLSQGDRLDLHSVGSWFCKSVPAGKLVKPDAASIAKLCRAFWGLLEQSAFNKEHVEAIGCASMPNGDLMTRQRAAFCIAWHRYKLAGTTPSKRPASPPVSPVGDPATAGIRFSLKLPADMPDRVRAIGQELNARYEERLRHDEAIGAPFVNWPDPALLDSSSPDVVQLIIGFTKAIITVVQHDGAWNRGEPGRQQARQQFCEYTLKLLFALAITPEAWTLMRGRTTRGIKAEQKELYNAARCAANGLDFVMPGRVRSDSTWLHQIDRVHAGSAADRQAHVEEVLAKAFLNGGQEPPKRRESEEPSLFEARQASFRREVVDAISVMAEIFGRSYGLAEQFDDDDDEGIDQLMNLASGFCLETASVVALPFHDKPVDYVNQRETQLLPAIQQCLNAIHNIK